MEGKLKKAAGRISLQTVTITLMLEVFTMAVLYSFPEKLLLRDVIIAMALSLMIGILSGVIRYISFYSRLAKLEHYYQNPVYQIKMRNGQTLKGYNAAIQYRQYETGTGEILEDDGKSMILFYVSDKEGKRKEMVEIKKEAICSIAYLREVKGRNDVFDQWIGELSDTPHS